MKMVKMVMLVMNMTLEKEKVDNENGDVGDEYDT